MQRIAVITDSGSNISNEEALQFDIHILPLQITIDEKTYQDTLDITTEEIFKLLREGILPKTSMPTYQRMEDLLIQLKNEHFDHVIAIPLSSGLSTTSDVLQTIARDVNIPLTIINTYSTCQLERYIAIRTKQMVDEGASVQEIVNRLTPKIENANSILLVKDLQHLKRGGRLTPVAASLASLLKIYPILHLNKKTNGRIDVLDKVRTESKAIKYAIQQTLSTMDLKNSVFFLIHTDYPKGIQFIKNVLLESGVPAEHIKIEYISSVIAVHTGMECICIQSIEKI